MVVQRRRTCHASLRGAGSPARFALAFATSVGGILSLVPSVCRGQIPGVTVPGSVSVGGGILDALGIGNPFASDGDKPFVELWYFWVVIAVIIIFVVAGSFFTYRGFKRWRNVREENRLKLVVQRVDEETEDWIIDMSRRTGRPVDRCLAAGARHCAGQPGESRAFNKAMTFAAKTMKRNRDVDDVVMPVSKLAALAEE